MVNDVSRATRQRLHDLLVKIIHVRGGLIGGFPMHIDKADEMSRLAAEALLVLDEPEALSPSSDTKATEPKPDPVADLCAHIKDSIRLCDHGYIHITCGTCTAPWLRS